MDLNPNELCCYSYMVSFERYSGSCNTLDDLYDKISVPSITGDVKLKVFDMITKLLCEKYWTCAMNHTT